MIHLRYSLRTLLLLVAVCAVGFGAWTHFILRERRFHDAVDRLRLQGISLEFGDRQSYSTFPPVTDMYVNANSLEWDSNTAAALSRLESVDTLRLTALNVAPEQQCLFGLPGLRSISLVDCCLTTSDVSFLIDHGANFRRVDVDKKEGAGNVSEFIALPSIELLSFIDRGFDRERVLEIPVCETLKELKLGAQITAHIPSMPALGKLRIVSALSPAKGSPPFMLDPCPRLREFQVSLADRMDSSDSLVGMSVQPALIRLELNTTALSFAPAASG